MENNNWTPYTGQKVIFLREVELLGIKKGDQYEVSETRVCKCGRVHVNLDILMLPEWDCDCVCGIIFIRPKYWWPDSSILAPVPPAYADATKDIMEKFSPVDERSDQPHPIRIGIDEGVSSYTAETLWLVMDGKPIMIKNRVIKN